MSEKYIPQKNVRWVGAQTLDWFYSWCRDHGIPGDNSKLKSGIIEGIFKPGAVAVPDLRTVGGYQFFIFPRKLEDWAAEYAVEVRSYENLT